MKINRFNEEKSELEINPDLIQFTIWCLETKKYFYDKDIKSWYIRKTLTKVTWNQVYTAYQSEKYNL